MESRSESNKIYFYKNNIKISCMQSINSNKTNIRSKTEE